MHIYVAVILLVVCFGLILGLWVHIVVPSKLRRQRLAAWVKEKTGDAICMVMLVAFVFWFVVLRRDYD